MSLSSVSPTSPTPVHQSATGRLPTTDTATGYKPEVDAALARARDKLVNLIRQEIDLCPARSIEGSLYVLLVAIASRFVTTLKRHHDLRDLFYLIRGGEIDNVKKFAQALPYDIKLDELIDDETKPAIEVAKMLGTVSKIRATVDRNDEGNLEFYDRLKCEIENGKINSFGALCDRFPDFIVNLNDELRNARGHFRDVRDSQRSMITDFRTRAKESVRQDILHTAFGTVNNVVLRTLCDLIDDFAEPELIITWKTLRDSAKAGSYNSISSFLASVPNHLFQKANQLVAAHVKQAR